mmetsp:Transcript_94002/g.251685  ORF Transcript_94002/g.251685 Transcript_94002/m.251685 type:complete len:89 (-) Transcript_94002:81-347(-)
MLSVDVYGALSGPATRAAGSFLAFVSFTPRAGQRSALRVLGGSRTLLPALGVACYHRFLQGARAMVLASNASGAEGVVASRWCCEMVL